MTVLFTRRHYIWLVEMAIALDLTDTQKKELIIRLHGTNPNFNATRFNVELVKLYNQYAGGI